MVFLYRIINAAGIISAILLWYCSGKYIYSKIKGKYSKGIEYFLSVALPFLLLFLYLGTAMIPEI